MMTRNPRYYGVPYLTTINKNFEFKNNDLNPGNKISLKQL